ncbi:carotene biosynthesis associated membrane protein [Mycolicibacterium chubuense NBB4]|uniref:Alpha-(1->6)-mannopyranosyltransferase A n=1 Tax=Mycolicibacterium chubuense (strain NBB4) TaxID=710421 RepID=I4BKW9_MYCCN|nr:alpha-(1->6)-mannopyranosyltransferase A [Mycolicibacterium chubuense]AFM17926.1 carotene biosynthesis associated membrane protein [Mycolicibacterium chubuense NBB4]
MITPAPALSKTGLSDRLSRQFGPGLRRLKDFTSSPEARPALLGALGAALITAGGLGAGSTRLHDPLLESMHLSWLRFGHGLVLSSVMLWVGVALMLIAWLRLGRRVIDGTAGQYTMIATTGFWLAPLLLSVPVFSRDTYSYLAQGALLRDGFDPYLVGPVENPNTLLDNVSPIWTTTTAPYGPAFILVAKFVTMLVGDDVVAGTMLLRLCMLPGLALLIWAVPRVARHVGANSAAALWICVLNPLVIIQLMGGVHNEMLMVGLMMAGIALSFGGRHGWGAALIAVAVAVKATAGLALPFMVWVWARGLRERRGYSPVKAFAAATAASVVIFTVVFAVLSLAAGVGLGWLTALAGSVKIINWLTVPTAASNLINVAVGLFMPVNFYAVLEIARIIGIAIIAVSAPLLWWRFRHTDRDALMGVGLLMIIVVLFVPAALPWYYTWPLAVMAALAQSRGAIALIAGFSTWITVLWRPDGAHGMYSWANVLIAAGCAAAAWYSLKIAPGPAEVSTPSPARGEPPHEPDASAAHPPGAH